MHYVKKVLLCNYYYVALMIAENTPINNVDFFRACYALIIMSPRTEN